MHPAAKVLHYATSVSHWNFSSSFITNQKFRFCLSQIFEGMKAFRGDDDIIRLFRPAKNMTRMNKSADRCCLPTFAEDELLKCITELVRIDQDFVPSENDYGKGCSLYIRPTLMGTTV
jgi:branched-chain amino acid aminotransferase